MRHSPSTVASFVAHPLTYPGHGFTEREGLIMRNENGEELVTASIRRSEIEEKIAVDALCIVNAWPKLYAAENWAAPTSCSAETWLRNHLGALTLQRHRSQNIRECMS